MSDAKQNPKGNEGKKETPRQTKSPNLVANARIKKEVILDQPIEDSLMEVESYHKLPNTDLFTSPEKTEIGEEEMQTANQDALLAAWWNYKRANKQKKKKKKILKIYRDENYWTDGRFTDDEDFNYAQFFLSMYVFYVIGWCFTNRHEGNLFNKVDAYFSSFRRCNYPRVSSAGVVEIVQECGRYSRFWDIPSPWWQASTILVGVASGLSLLVGVTAAAACCVSYVVHTGTARAAGFLQLCAALMVSSGVALYPIGWDNREIKESCGDSAHVYKIGNCSVSWSAYLLLGAVILLLFCFGLSFCASRIKPGGSFRI